MCGCMCGCGYGEMWVWGIKGILWSHFEKYSEDGRGHMTATEADGVPWLRFRIIFQTATIADITELCLPGIIIISSDVKIWPSDPLKLNLLVVKQISVCSMKWEPSVLLVSTVSDRCQHLYNHTPY